MKTQIVFGSHNPNKAVEVGRILEPFGIEVIPIPDDVPDPVEDEETFLANATIKAREIAEATGLITLADDSGIIVPKLGTESVPVPGPLSARLHMFERVVGGCLTGFDKTRQVSKGDRAQANNAALIRLMQDRDIADRVVYYEIVLVVAAPNGQVLSTFTGRSDPGFVIDRPRGDGGFGFDPIFFDPKRGLTIAEMSAAQKDEISHRGRALRNFAVWVKDGGLE